MLSGYSNQPLVERKKKTLNVTDLLIFELRGMSGTLTCAILLHLRCLLSWVEVVYSWFSLTAGTFLHKPLLYCHHSCWRIFASVHVYLLDG